jgi:hypothetical protein
MEGSGYCLLEFVLSSSSVGRGRIQEGWSQGQDSNSGPPYSKLRTVPRWLVSHISNKTIPRVLISCSPIWDEYCLWQLASRYELASCESGKYSIHSKNDALQYCRAVIDIYHISITDTRCDEWESWRKRVNVFVSRWKHGSLHLPVITLSINTRRRILCRYCLVM